MKKAEQIKFVRGLMQEQYEKMINSKYHSDKLYAEQQSTLFSIAAGATPDLPVGIIWDMIREVLN